MNTRVRLGLTASAAMLMALSLTQCQSARNAPIVTDSTTIESIREGGELVVLTLKGPTTFSNQNGVKDGYEYDMAERFAETLGVKTHYVVMKNVEELVAGIERGDGHIGAAGLTFTDSRAERVKFGPAYKNVAESVVCHRKGPQPANFDELADVQLVVLDGSSYEETLTAKQADFPALNWTTRAAGSAMPMLAAVAHRQIDCTVADSHLAEHARRMFPDLTIPMTISQDRPIGWIYNGKIADMDQMLAGWFLNAHETGYLANLDERWFGHLEEFDYVEVLRFVERVEQRLPAFRTYFEAAASTTDFDWHLLAAQAYQESHWDPDARSPTGVEGLMMLTLPTARELGVADRKDPEQSVDGGARYLQRIYERLPDGIEGEDRLWFALAAYNIGMGHIYDARRIAERQGLDKNSWDDMERVLPLLSRPKYYQTVRHGYARGNELVIYVRKVRDYYNMLRANVPV